MKKESLRLKVFIEEQKVPIELEWDEHDASSTHFLAILNGKAVAVARLKSDGQIGRMAVVKEYRNRGFGSQLLQFVLRHAAKTNMNTVYLHAQTTAIPFYEKHGFAISSEIFYDANIAHRSMLKIIC